MGFWPFGRRRPTGQPGAPRAPDPPRDGDERPARGQPLDSDERPAGGQPLGPLGEQLARRFLRKAGMKILADNYRCPAGEVDLIALDRSTRKALGAETIVFVEVKTRRSDRYASPAAAVDSPKQTQLRAAAAYYLAHHDAAGYLTRYDIVSIVARPGQEPEISHIRNAF